MRKYAVITTSDSHLDQYILIDDSIENRTKLVNELKLEYKPMYDYDFLKEFDYNFCNSIVDELSYHYKDYVNNGMGIFTIKIITKDKLLSDLESQFNSVKEKINDNFSCDILDKTVGIIYPKFYDNHAMENYFNAIK